MIDLLVVAGFKRGGGGQGVLAHVAILIVAFSPLYWPESGIKVGRHVIID